jgi:hypothetical protein
MSLRYSSVTRMTLAGSKKLEVFIMTIWFGWSASNSLGCLVLCVASVGLVRSVAFGREC